MLFNSIQFLIFFPLVAFAYFAMPQRYRWAFLLAASYYFYMSWKPEYIVLIIGSTLVDYYVGLRMGKADTRAARRPYLILSLCVNLGILFGFKYLNFFSESARMLFDQVNIFYGVPAFDLLLPVGISFYTFQTLSYSIDVYRGKQKPERHLGIFALYVAFFPQLVAGPIERSTHLIPQFRQKHDFDYDRVTSGLKLMAWGFFKKLVIADRLAVFVDAVYNSPQEYTGVPLIIATYAFAFQIYCDFSGYSDIAIGAARVLGIDLMENFRLPYLAKSIPDFWRRWHISLSTWFRDYLYIPLGGNRVPMGRMAMNLMIVFVLSGLWHGANWTFVLWGALHGLFMIIAVLISSLWRKGSGVDIGAPRLVKVLQIAGTFNLVCFAWIFFRANSIGDAWYIVTHLFSGLELRAGYGIGGGGAYELSIAALAIVIMELVHWLRQRGDLQRLFMFQPIWVRWTAYYALVFFILVLGKFGVSEFIYFQF